mgnify:CR=1 FL=1
MANYVDSFNLDEEKLQSEIKDWTTNLRKEIEGKIPKWYYIAKWLIPLMSGIFALIGIIFVFLDIIVFENVDHGNIFLIIGIIFLIISGIIGWLSNLIVKKYRAKFEFHMSQVIVGYGSRLYSQWFANAFDYEELSNQYDNNFIVDNKALANLIQMNCHNSIGASQTGIIKNFNIMGGKIFNSPFKLSCGIFLSANNLSNSVIWFNEYMPMLQIKTNAFDEVDLIVTNSKEYQSYQKNKLNFGNEKFNENFSVVTNDDVKAFVIFTPLVQEKWVSQLENAPKFQMHITNGKINVQFQGFAKNGSSITPFMNLIDYYQKEKTIKGFFETIDYKIFNDIKSFSKILNYVFSISFFQWEDSTNNKLITNNKNVNILIEPIKKIIGSSTL